MEWIEGRMQIFFTMVVCFPVEFGIVFTAGFMANIAWRRFRYGDV
ncbi:hypothetical protein Poly59_30950 [Rubripirellula reticaptiva]|uniref:Uncharacterized protein n=1 Tax=Rubripirellula reticaptiva TaxID=2528013 RepID=A0A5C6EP17_9BACT|nr:hypothetical protein Poly59_30950 [Rubripirellula reticaptiva]